MRFNPTNGQLQIVAGGASAGVSSISATGEPQLTGDVTISAGSNVTLTQVGNDIEIASSGGSGSPGGSDTQLQYNNAGAFGGITNATSDGTTLTITSGRVVTDLSPSSNDGATLGTSALQYSDLYLAEGAVINWDNGDATITQTGNSVVLAGANLGIATGTPDSPLSIANTTTSPVAPQAGTLAHLYSNGANNARIVGDVYSNATNQGFGFQGRKSRGSIGSPSAPNADDTLAFVGGNGYGTTGFPSVSVGALVVRAESGSFTDTSQPTYIALLTSPTGTITPTERMRISSTGYTTIQVGTTINESGADSDTRIEGDTDQNLFFVDASADFIGIGKNNPAVKLDVTGEIRASTAGTNSASVVTVGGTQTLTGKTINGSSNTLTVLAGTQLSGQVPLTNGGTGASLSDPGADRILFWDDSGAAVDWLTASTGLTISGTSMTVRTSSTTQTGIVELATDAESATGTDTSRAVTPSGLTAFIAGYWNNVTGTTQTAAVNKGYIANNGSLVTVTLPSTAAVGSVVEVAGSGAGGWRVAQNSGQTIHFGVLNTTSGTGGRLDSSNRYDTVKLVCTTADTDWVVISSQGNITVT